jgi:hypothetical protein
MLAQTWSQERENGMETTKARNPRKALYGRPPQIWRWIG